jgi:hypothetical protein
MTIYKKLLMGFSGMAILVTVVGAASIYSLSTTVERLRQVADTSLREIHETNREAAATVILRSQIDAFQNDIGEHRLADARVSQARAEAAFANLAPSVESLREEARYMLSQATTPQEISEENEQLVRLNSFDAIACNWKIVWKIAADTSLRENTVNQNLFDPSDDAARDIGRQRSICKKAQPPK